MKFPNFLIVTTLTLAVLITFGAHATDFKPRMIYDLGRGDKSFNETSLNGTQDFEKDHGVRFRDSEINNDSQRGFNALDLITVFASLIAIAIGAYNFYVLWNRRNIYYRFHAKFALSNEFYSIKPSLTITNLSEFEWSIQKIYIAELPLHKAMMAVCGRNKACKININKLKILKEFEYDDFHPRFGDFSPIKPRTERCLVIREDVPIPRETEKPNLLYWIAMINEGEFIVGSRRE